MPYTGEISRNNPTCVIFVLDQSTSMNMKIEGGQSKAAFLADVLNKTLYTLITTCTKADGIRDYFYVGVVAYSGTAARNGLAGHAGEDLLHPISHLANTPLRVEERRKKILTESDQIVEQPVKFPVWFEPVSAGKTPMVAGLSLAADLVRQWCSGHTNGYPPTVLHVTDGHPTDGDPEPASEGIKRLGTEDGPALLFNLHIDIGPNAPVAFPKDDSCLPDKYARRLFRMSSVLPTHLTGPAREKGYSLEVGSRGFIFNGDPTCIADFFDIGTRPQSLTDR
ncbi:MAG: vWA domain-containing protein [candidate division NC10 bacterium]|nr:vWA domain-containing protein [candidate division NC10 bacterium]